jgi:hypothetical protein
MDMLDLMFDAFAITIQGDNLVIVVFSKNLGNIRLVLPLTAIADFFQEVTNDLEN